MSRSEGSGGGQAGREAPEEGYWAEIYERYHREVRARFVGRVRCSHDVDDLVQNVFASLITQGRVPRSPQAYVHTLARHQLWTYWRRHRRTDLVIERVVTTRRDEGQADALRGEFQLDPPAYMQRMENVQIVHKMVERLSPALARTVRLRFVEGLSPAEAAARIGCSREAMKKNLTRAKRALAELRPGD